jgi:hypothetical protein
MLRKTVVSERVIRTILNEHPSLRDSEERITKYRLAKKANCSQASFLRIFRNLLDENLVTNDLEPNFIPLIGKWTNLYITPTKREYFLKQPLNIIKKSKLNYALTTYVADNLIQNYLFPKKTDIYIEKKDYRKWHNLILTDGGLVSSGNIRLLITDEHVFYHSVLVNDLRIVSIPQVIVDLMHQGGICIEAAEMLMEKVVSNTLMKA